MPTGLEGTRFASVDAYLTALADTMAELPADSAPVRQLLEVPQRGSNAWRMGTATVELRKAYERELGAGAAGATAIDRAHGVAARSATVRTFSIASSAVGGLLATTVVLAILLAVWPYAGDDVAEVKRVLAEKGERIERLMTVAQSQIDQLEDLVKQAGSVDERTQHTQRSVDDMRRAVAAIERELGGLKKFTEDELPRGIVAEMLAEGIRWKIDEIEKSPEIP